MSTTILDSSFDTIKALHTSLGTTLKTAPTLASASQDFVEALASHFSTIVLARLFVVRPLSKLHPDDQQTATDFARAAGRPVPLGPETPTLCLLGTTGHEPAWCSRVRSAGHRAIPLIDKQLVDGAPMIAALLASLNVELASLEGSAGVQLRTLAGRLNARFYVPDARTAVDGVGRHIIASREFVAKYGIRTVFGMGGTYLEGELVATILFTKELLQPLHVDRFPSLISTFKMATGHLIGPNLLV